MLYVQLPPYLVFAKPRYYVRQKRTKILRKSVFCFFNTSPFPPVAEPLSAIEVKDFRENSHHEIRHLRPPRHRLCCRIHTSTRNQDFLHHRIERIRVRAGRTAAPRLLRPARSARRGGPNPLRPSAVRRGEARTHRPARVLGEYHHARRAARTRQSRPSGRFLRFVPQWPRRAIRTGFHPDRWQITNIILRGISRIIHHEGRDRQRRLSWRLS